MKKLVILGTGFSVPAQLPTMAEFRKALMEVLPSAGAHQVSQSRNPIPERTILKAVLEEWDRRSAACLCKADDLESFCLSVEERPDPLHQVDGKWPPPDPWDLYASVRYATVRVCDLKLTQGPTQKPDDVWEKFYLRFAREVTDAGDVRVVTLNYDLLLDQALIQQRILPEYHLDPDRVREVNAQCERHKPNGPEKLTLLKPHGSFNWFVCRNRACRLISLKWEYGPWDGVLRARPGNWPTGRETHHRCEHQLTGEEALQFLLLLPRKEKQQERSFLPEVWQAVESAAAEAEQVFFLGWSAPPSDKHMRKIFRSYLRPDVKVWVVNLDIGPDIQQRYDALLPSCVARECIPVRFGVTSAGGDPVGLDGSWWTALVQP